jgi:hypothetical protein
VLSGKLPQINVIRRVDFLTSLRNNMNHGLSAKRVLQNCISVGTNSTPIDRLSGLKNIPYAFSVLGRGIKQ